MPWDQAKYDTYARMIHAKDQDGISKGKMHEFSSLLKLKNYQALPPYKTTIQTGWNALAADVRSRNETAWAYVKRECGIVAGAQPMPGVGAVGGAQPMPAVDFRQAAAIAQQKAIARLNAATEINEKMTQTMNGGPNDWSARFRIMLSAHGSAQKDATVIVPIAAFGGNSVQFQAAQRSGLVGNIPAGHTGVPLDSAVKANWSSRLAERWGGGEFRVKSGPAGDVLERYKINFTVEFVEDSNKAAQAVFAVRNDQGGDGTVNTDFWGVDDGGSTGAAIAHEFGHLIGNPDEYGNVVFRTKSNANIGDQDGIMKDETHGHVRVRYFYMIGTRLAQALGKLPANCELYFNNATHPVALDHPWH